MQAYKINGVEFKIVHIEPCLRLVQFGKGLPITCSCSACFKRNQTVEEAKISMEKAHAN